MLKGKLINLEEFPMGNTGKFEQKHKLQIN